MILMALSLELKDFFHLWALFNQHFCLIYIFVLFFLLQLEAMKWVFSIALSKILIEKERNYPC